MRMAPMAGMDGEAAVFVGADCYGEWRWRESNPRPRVTNQVFSGRSWLGVLSAPALAPARCRQAQTQFISLLSPEPTLSR